MKVRIRAWAIHFMPVKVLSNHFPLYLGPIFLYFMYFKLVIVVLLSGLVGLLAAKPFAPIGDNIENLEHTPAAAARHLSGSVQG